ncbi:MAG TPA: aminotransferase class III-fold pyridoxal phosphate-dependent enzyme, partial [Burkholderiales bacterium]|nr:aminotransferase class III-fold pyridoxal phosphate-dependent enzyme [Burkholderiales bacterium]
MGEIIRDGIRVGLEGIAGVREIRGKGLMIGIELDYPCDELVKHALEIGLLINVTSDNVVRLLPPLTIKRGEAEQLVTMLVPLITDFLIQTRAAPPAMQSA